MGNPMLTTIILGIVALLMILKLRNTLGTRDGFEPTPGVKPAPGQEFSLFLCLQLALLT